MSRSILIVLGIFLPLYLASGERVRFDNYHVYKVTHKNMGGLKLLTDLKEDTNSMIFLNSVKGKSIHIAVAPEKCSEFQLTLNRSGTEYELVHANLQKRLNAEEEVIPNYREYNWEQYHILNETYDWLDSIASRYSKHAEVIIGGSTYEGREIKGVKVSFKEGNKGIFIEGGTHAREWLSPATVTYILNELLTSQDQQVRKMAESYDWYVFPHTNPDGYVYSHTTHRLWRKTRSPTSDPDCYGADPNRNWDFHWMEVGANSSPCSNIYAGTKPFSEIEVRSLAEYIESLKGKIHIYLSFHAYSQLLLFPYGYTEEHAVNHNHLQKIGDFAVKALAKRYGTLFVAGNTNEVIYPASGGSIDYAYGKANINLSYAYELRPTKDDWDGFLISPENIIPGGEEIVDSLVALVKKAKCLGYL